MTRQLLVSVAGIKSFCTDAGCQLIIIVMQRDASQFCTAR